MRRRTLGLLIGITLSGTAAEAACCYFAAQDKDINQPGQKAFITWDPAQKLESFTVQPRFEGDARDFGMVVPTPSRPRLDEMPRDFFKHLAVYTILLPLPQPISSPLQPQVMLRRSAPVASFAFGGMQKENRERGVTVLEQGVVGSLDYKIITAEDPDGLFEWLKESGYAYAGDVDTLKFYIDQSWIFTVMKIDTNQMKKNPDGSYQGEVTPTRFQFASASLVYPLKITAISVRDSTEALFYVQAPVQMDLEGTWSWAYSYRVMYLTSGRVCLSLKQFTSEEQQELQDRQQTIDRVRREIPGYDTTKLEWARRLDTLDRAMLETPGETYGQYRKADWPAGATEVTVAELKDAFWNQYQDQRKQSPKTFPEQARSRLDSLDGRYPPGKGTIARVLENGATTPSFYWMPDREAPAADVEALGQLKGHLVPGQFLTKFRKSFAREEMTRDLRMVPVPAGRTEEYIRILPQSPP